MNTNIQSPSTPQPAAAAPAERWARIGSSLKRAALPALALSALAVNSCAPILDPNHPDQAPDVNYALTSMKDAQYVGSIAAVDAIVNAKVGTEFPGAAIAIVSGGQIVYMKGYGIARFVPDSPTPFTKDTVAGIGSISKVLTSIGMMRLVEMGEVNLNDTIDSFFPHAVPAGWNQVTVRDVMCHQAGFARDPDPALPGALSAAEVEAAFGEEKASQQPRYGMWEFLLSADGTPNLAQVGNYSYSNIGFTILGAIIDQITQSGSFAPFQGYERFVWSLVAGADDAALTAVLNHPWRDGDIPNLATSYNSSWNPTDANYSGWEGPAGGWSMTIGDLARIAIALKENQILTPASLQAMRNNQGSFYGLGLQLDPKNFNVVYGHGGAINGFRSRLSIWPGKDIAVVAFVNRGLDNVNGNIVDLYGQVDEMVTDIGDLWIEYKESIQEAEFIFSEEDENQMQTAAFEVSKHHFGEAEKAMQAMIRGEGFDYGKAFELLKADVKRQGATGASLLDRMQRDPSDRETAASEFLSLLGEDEHVGPYQPGVDLATDSDRDRLPDTWEREKAGDLKTLAAWRDSDHDGPSDGDEHTAATHPLDPASQLRLWVTKGSKGPEVRWTCESNRLYTLFSSSDCKRWEPVREVSAAPGERDGEMELQFDPPKDGSPRFWRVEVAVP